MIRKLKTAIVYDWLDKWGGVERLLLVLNQNFPQAVFFTSYYNLKTAHWASKLKIETSFVQKLPSFIKNNRLLSLPLYPYAFESFDFNQYDLVISVTSSFAKSIITKPGVLHLCYLLTPARYFWVHPELYVNNWLLKNILSGYLDKLRNRDYITAQRPDYIFSISKTVADKCLKFYDRKSEVIYPPFDIKYWQNIKSQISKIKNTYQKLNILEEISHNICNKKKGQYFLIVSRLEPYKRVDLAVSVFNKLDKNLVIVGEGSQFTKLKRMANKNIVFLKNLTDEELGFLYQNAQALIMPQEEDFGYVALEAQFFGCPIIAFRKGGATETIIEGKTGIFFDKQTKNSLINALERFYMISYNLRQSTNILGIRRVGKFSRNNFEKKLKDFLDEKLRYKKTDNF